MDEVDRLKKQIEALDKDRWSRQYLIMKVFDQLIYNMDRNASNMLYDKEWRLWMIDHSRAFRRHAKLPNEKTLDKCEAALLARIKDLKESDALDSQGLREADDEGEHFGAVVLGEAAVPERTIGIGDKGRVHFELGEILQVGANGVVQLFDAHGGEFGAGAAMEEYAVVDPDHHVFGADLFTVGAIVTALHPMFEPAERVFRFPFLFGFPRWRSRQRLRFLFPICLPRALGIGGFEGGEFGGDDIAQVPVNVHNFVIAMREWTRPPALGACFSRARRRSMT